MSQISFIREIECQYFSVLAKKLLYSNTWRYLTKLFYLFIYSMEKVCERKERYIKKAANDENINVNKRNNLLEGMHFVFQSF